MPLESGTKISDLNPNWPLGNDPKSQGDDHLRLIKNIVQNDALSKADGGTVAGQVNFTLSPIGAAGASGNQLPIADDIPALAGIAPQTIIEADPLAGWQVWGDILIQWGQAPNTGSPTAVTFPTAFKVAPAVTVSALQASTFVDAASLQNVTATGFSFFTAQLSSGSPSSAAVKWVAVGEAPDNLKKPKVVDVAGVDGGGGGGIPEAPQNGNYYARRDAAWSDVANAFLALTGGAMTGKITLDGAPTLPLHAATKQYVDDNTGGGGIPDAPNANNHVRRLGSWVASDPLYAASSHTHTESQITDLDKYSQAQTDALLADKVDVETGGTTSRGQSVWVGSSAELAAITNGPGRDAQTLYFVLE